MLQLKKRSILCHIKKQKFEEPLFFCKLDFYKGGSCQEEVDLENQQHCKEAQGHHLLYTAPEVIKSMLTQDGKTLSTIKCKITLKLWRIYHY